MEPTSNRHQTDRGTTGSDVESDAWDRIVSGTYAFSMSYSIVNELGSKVPRGLGQGKKNVRELFFICLVASPRASFRRRKKSAKSRSDAERRAAPLDRPIMVSSGVRVKRFLTPLDSPFTAIPKGLNATLRGLNMTLKDCNATSKGFKVTSKGCDMTLKNWRIGSATEDAENTERFTLRSARRGPSYTWGGIRVIAPHSGQRPLLARKS